MKRRTFLLLIGFFLLISLSGCRKTDYSLYLSDVKSDLFLAQTEEYEIAVSCLERERPFLLDGIPAAMSKSLEVTLTEKQPSSALYEIYFLEDVPRGGEMSFRSVSGDYAYSRGVEVFPSGSVSLRVVRNGQSEDILATSVKSEKTIGVLKALSCAVEAEKETIARMSENGFRGEFHVRLLKRDKTYYYVGMIDEQGGTVSLLLDSETGNVLARREKR